MDGQHQLVAVADEGHLSLGKAPQVLHARVVLGNLESEAGGVVGVLQVLAIGVLVGLGHFVGVDDEAGEQGEVRGLLADFLGVEGEFLVAGVILLDDLPPAVDGLAIGERFGVVIPEGLRGVQGIAVLQVLLGDVGADVPGIEGLDDALVIVLVEHFSVDVLGLEHVGGDVSGFVFHPGLAQDLVGVQVGDHQVQAGKRLLKGLLFLQHLGGGGVDVDGGVFLQGQLVELLVGHVAPLVIVGAIDVFSGVHVIAQLQVGGGSGVAAVGRLLGPGGGAGVGGGLGIAALVAAAGGQAEDHYQGHQQRKEFLLHQIFSFRFGEIVMLESI